MKRNKGITLIALVINIVVLIILAGVAISLSIGENGIFNKAKYASETYLNEQVKEEVEIGKYPNSIDKFVNGGTRNDSEYHIERGSLNITFPRTWVYEIIQFEKQYTQIPEVYYKYNAGNSGGSIYISNVTTSSFRIGYNSFFSTIHSDVIEWIAIGK